jgi:hypothetical protein
MEGRSPSSLIIKLRRKRDMEDRRLSLPPEIEKDLRDGDASVWLKIYAKSVYDCSAMKQAMRNGMEVEKKQVKSLCMACLGRKRGGGYKTISLVRCLSFLSSSSQ